MRKSLPGNSFRMFPALLAAVLALGACGGGADDGEAGAGEAADSESADGMAPDAGTVAGDTDAASADSVATLPDWFPEDVYVPEAYTVVGAMDVGDVQRIELRTEGSVGEVAAQAGAAMQAKGWGEGKGTGETMGYTQGDRSAMLTINQRDDGAVRVGYQFTTL